jgi:hypothetical protein
MKKYLIYSFFALIICSRAFSSEDHYAKIKVQFKSKEIARFSGKIKVFEKNGTEKIINSTQKIPKISPNSQIELLSGKIKISPDSQFNLIAGNAFLPVKNSKLDVSVDEKTGKICCMVKQGKEKITFGNTKILLTKNQAISLDVEKETGLEIITSLSGRILTDTAGIKAFLPKNSVLLLLAKPKLRQLHLFSKNGKVDVLSPQGKLTNLLEGKEEKYQIAKNRQVKKLGKTIPISISSILGINTKNENPLIAADVKDVIAEDITKRTGNVLITQPDGNVVEVKPAEIMPKIQSGSVVELMEGSWEIKAKVQDVTYIVGDATMNLTPGDHVKASVDTETGTADVEVVKSEKEKIKIKVGNTNITLKQGDIVSAGVDDITGVEEIKSVSGRLETETVGISITIEEGASALIMTNAESRQISVESKEGTLEVTDIDGEISTLTEGEGVTELVAGNGEIISLGLGISVEDQPLTPLRAQPKTMEAIEMEFLIQDIPPEPERIDVIQEPDQDEATPFE